MATLGSSGREPTSGHAFIIHQPNAPSGGRLSHIELGELLRDGNGVEQQALPRLIGTLVEVPLFAQVRKCSPRLATDPPLLSSLSLNAAGPGTRRSE